MIKKTISIWAALVLVSCTKEKEAGVNTPTNGGIPFELVANSADTKSVNDGLSTKWAEDDAVNVFHAVAGTTDYVNDGEFKITDVESGIFTGMLASALDPSQAYDWYVYYPYNPDITSPENSSGYNTVAESTQFQLGNDSKAHLAGLPLAGKTTTDAGVSNPTISMKQLAAVIKVVVTNNSGDNLPVKRLEISSSVNMAGSYSVNFVNPENPVYTEKPGSVKSSVTLDAAVSTGKAGQSTYYIAIKPFEAAASTTMTLKVNNYEKSVVLDSDKVFSAGTIYPVPFNYDTPDISTGFRILVIGNSYDNGMLYYVKDMLNAAGLNSGFSLYKLYRSGASYKNWYDVYNGQDSYEYQLSRVWGDTINELGDVIAHKYVDNDTQKAGYKGNDNAGFLATLGVDWDIILFHTVSSYSNDYTKWEGHTNAGYLNEYVNILRSFNPNAIYGFVLVHSFHSDYSANTERSSELRWRHIAESAKWILDSGYASFIIPYGTAVQSIRLTTLNDEDDFSFDAIHLSDGLAKYAAGATFYETIFAPIYGISILGNTFTKTNIPSGPGVVQITAENALLAQEAAIWAVKAPYNLHNPEETDTACNIQTTLPNLRKGGGSALPVWDDGDEL